MSITSINSATTTPSSTASAIASSTPAAQQADFMTLLIAQMRNQDPLNPMDNNQMAAQMAQLNMVSGINDMNATLTGLSNNQQINNSLQATGLIGHKVEVISNKTQLVAGASQIGMDVSQNADNVFVNIKDDQGNIISSLNLGPKTAGIQNISWNGQTDSGTPAIDGVYTFDITATSNGAPISTTALSSGIVKNISISGGQVKANVDPLGDVALADIHQVI